MVHRCLRDQVPQGILSPCLEQSRMWLNGYKVVFTDVNCTNESSEVEQMMDKYKIEGYPTIKLLKDGQIIEYDAKPSKDTLTQFLNTVL